jgi:predicted nucleic acid-binding protein
MSDLGVMYDPPGEEAAALCGRILRAYRSAGGARSRLVPDFLVGAHATSQADRLLTRDRGFFRAYFETLPVVDPGIRRR